MRRFVILVFLFVVALPLRAADTLTLTGQDVTYTIGAGGGLPSIGEDDVVYSTAFLLSKASVLAGTNTLWFDVGMSADSTIKLNSFAALSITVSVIDSASRLLSFYAFVDEGQFTASTNLFSTSAAYARHDLNLVGSTASNFAETGITYERELYTANSDGGLFEPGTQTATLASSVQVVASAVAENRKGASWSMTSQISGFGMEATVLTATPVPEPEIYGTLALGLSLLGWLGRRRIFREG